MDLLLRRKLGYGASPTAGEGNHSDTFSYLLGVKSSRFSLSLTHERLVRQRLDSCRKIVRCFGDDITVERGEKLFDLVLEYAHRGNLRDQLAMCGFFSESLARRYTRGILKVLDFIHSIGFVHCDIQLKNIWVVDNGDVKIADFRSVKMAGEKISPEKGNFDSWTPLFTAPESISDNEYESPCDIWALGCAVLAMCTGRSGWNFGKNLSISAESWGFGIGMPSVPTDFSDEGIDFLQKCVIKDPTKRWSAQMLLNHPFVADMGGQDEIQEKIEFRKRRGIGLAPSV